MGWLLAFEVVNGLVTGTAAFLLVREARERSGRDLPRLTRAPAGAHRAPGA